MYETTTKVERNKFVIAHLTAGKSLKEVQQLLVDSGYGKIDTTRIWKIWNRSPDFVERRPKEKFCSFCLENKPVEDIYNIQKKAKIIGRICEDCWKKKPEQPVELDEVVENEQRTN